LDASEFSVCSRARLPQALPVVLRCRGPACGYEPYQRILASRVNAAVFIVIMRPRFTRTRRCYSWRQRRVQRKRGCVVVLAAGGAGIDAMTVVSLEGFPHSNGGS